MTSIDPTVMTVKNLIVLDSEGKRIVVSYFSPEWATVAQQAEYEKSLFNKTSRTNARGEAEIIMFDNVVVIYKTLGDLTFYITGDENENELVLFSVLHAFYETINLLLRGAVEKKTALENLDQVLVAIDEIVDGGLILETDPQVVASRVSMRSADSPGFDVPFAEQTFSQAFASAKEHLARSLLK
ncbi:hypothetical protein BSKO_04421 [Bryopsis sp. KO-2023]|nr:hypothetical protein BSKO_04421 [Bryopsis sp. KO-2023]